MVDVQGHFSYFCLKISVAYFYSLQWDRQSSHPVKTLLQYYGKSLEALPGVAYPGFRDNHSTLNTKTGFLKKWKVRLSNEGCHC